MIRLPRAAFPQGFGTMLPVWMVFFGAWVFAVTDAFVLPSNLLGVNGPDIALNLWLLGGLGALTVLWAGAVHRGWATAVSGAGLVLAGCALSARIYCEFLLSLLGAPSHGTWDVPALPWVREGGLVGYAFGVSCVLATVLWERRLRRMDRPETRPTPPFL